MEPLRRFYDRSAKGYDRWMRYYDGLLLGDRRRTICSVARGRTLELGVGTGLNFASYPRDVQLVGVDLSAEMLAIAGRRARDLGMDVHLRVGDAQALDLPDSSFDTVVATLVLSAVPDARRATAEAWRVLKPDGRFLILDHVRSPVAVVRWAEQLLDPLVSRLAHVHLLHGRTAGVGGDLLRRLVHGVTPASRQHHGGALAPQRLGDGQPNAGAGARDDCDFSL